VDQRSPARSALQHHHAEINERRMLWLEIIVVVFFAIDLLAIFFLKK